MATPLIYSEKVSSNRTEVLFIVLAFIFLLLFGWQAYATPFSWLSILFFCFFGFFLFYALNYRILTIRLDEKILQLRFGSFTWVIPRENIETCFQDRTSLWRIGGAGIHFTVLGGRYRAMFNFLEHPRVVISLITKKGPVRDIAFSIRWPEQVICLLQMSEEKKKTI